jgi:hypothetical protein
VLWWVVAFGALMNIVLIWMQDMEIHVHLILGAVLASILGAVIFLIVELDNPFRGEVSIGPESIARVYETVMSPDESATDRMNKNTADLRKALSRKRPDPRTPERNFAHDLESVFIELPWQHHAASSRASQGPNSLRITSQVLPAAVSFSQNLSSGTRSSSAMAMM